MSGPRSVLLIGCLLFAPAAAEAVERCPGGLATRIVPLPVYATLPNEGDTFGAMPVFLRVCDVNARTESIIAPSITWNDVIHWTGTFRLFHYPSDEQTLTFIASASTRINSGVLLQWRDLPRAPGGFTTEVELRWQRSAFFRFFGLGPDTPENAETSYTRARGHAGARYGLNLGGNWNAGVGLLFDTDSVQDMGVPGLPLSRRVFPDTPGMGGSTIIGQTIDLRFDTRFIAGAARFDWTAISTPRAPFYDQSTLGCAFLLRGFTEDRFIDQNAWTFEAEQRIRLFQTHIYGVTADWRIDPFIAVGQVYRAIDQAFSRPRVAGGVGLRAWVRPNVVGRIDIANGGEGWKVYVEIGYPY